MGANRVVIAGLLLAATNMVVYGGAPKPTSADIAYGRHERNKLDFWKAKSAKPTPLIVFFHGGGFRAGDKSDIGHFLVVEECLAKGVSVATVNYPFLHHTSNDYTAIMKDCERAVTFLTENAGKWNIDVKRVAAAGCSAGALISEWLGCKTTDISALGIFLQPIGTEYMILRNLNRRFPPTIIYQASGPDDEVHHPLYAQKLKDACDEKRVTCELWGSKKSGLPQLPEGKKPQVAMLEFFFKQWNPKRGERTEHLNGRAPLVSGGTAETIKTDESREIRTWTARSGSSIRARLISEATGYVVLRKAGGQRLKISSSSLSKEDQEYLQALR